MDVDVAYEADLLARVLAQAGDAAEYGRDAPVRAEEDGWRSWDLPGVLGTARVATSFGLVPAQLVRVGDSVRTRTGGFERVQRIAQLKIDEDFLTDRPDAAPVIIRSNALAAGAPHHDLGLSPGQIVSVGPNRFEDRLVRAAEVSRQRGRIDRSLGSLVYVQLHLAREAQINCEGVWVAAVTG